jgi:hypothetical protein
MEIPYAKTTGSAINGSFAVFKPLDYTEQQRL